MEKQRRSPSLIWPAILITAGIVFLLNNLGLLPWEVWATLLSLWPVLLIAIGLDILIGRRSTWGSALIALLLVAAFVGAAWFGVPDRGQAVASAPQSHQEIRHELEGANRGVIDIGFSIGQLRVDALGEGAGLVEGSIDLLTGERLIESFRKQDSTAHYRLSSSGQIGFPSAGIRLGEHPEHPWNLSLTRDIPLDLTISAGVGESVLDLSQLELSRLEVKNGIGAMSLKLPRNGSFAAIVHVGIGEVNVMIPASMEARIRGEAGLGSLDVQGQFIRRNDTYESAGFASAANRVDIDVNGGIGRVSVVRQSEE